MRYSIKLSYSGAQFCGWQRQPDAPSVQETLETALGTLLGVPVPVIGAGRTDTGVNAIGYIASFDAEGPIDGHYLCYKLNAILPSSIVVIGIQEESPEFHARFDAKRREYTYFLHRCKDPFIVGSSYFYGYPELDFEKMNEAAALLLGTHDFSCFEKTGADNRTSICTIFEAEWRPYVPSHVEVMGWPGEGVGERVGEQGGAAGEQSGVGWRAGQENYWYFRIAADRFLRNMVRAIVGTLLEVGRGKRSPDSIPALLESHDRCSAGESAPGHALFLSKVEY